MYRLGSIRRTTVKAVEAITATVNNASSMMMQLLDVSEECEWTRDKYYRIMCDAIPRSETDKGRQGTGWGEC